MKWIVTIFCLSVITTTGCSNSNESQRLGEERIHGSREPSAMLGAAEKVIEKLAPNLEVLQTVCPVSGEELGSMGKPVTVTYEGQTVQFCCRGCVKKFNANPESYLAKLNRPHEER